MGGWRGATHENGDEEEARAHTEAVVDDALARHAQHHAPLAVLRGGVSLSCFCSGWVGCVGLCCDETYADVDVDGKGEDREADQLRGVSLSAGGAARPGLPLEAGDDGTHRRHDVDEEQEVPHARALAHFRGARGWG